MLKPYIVAMSAAVTGRKCSRCVHSRRGRCTHPDAFMFRKCWQTVTRPGFEKRPPRYLRPDTKLTAEEQHQLQKIKTMLQDAEDDARESGLLED